MTNADQQERPKTSRRSWLICLVIAAAATTIGTVLDVTRPLWFGPPLLVYTPLAYALLPWVWLPILLTCVLLRRIRGWKPLLLVLILGLLFGCFWSAIVGPRTGPELPYLGANGTFLCRDEPSAGGLDHYVCEHRFSSSDVVAVTYTFSRLSPLPLVALVDIEPHSQ
jgi:hypothetical protein